MNKCCHQISGQRKQEEGRDTTRKIGTNIMNIWTYLMKERQIDFQGPEERSWDHKIKIKKGFKPKSFKTYNLTPGEQIEQDKFLE